MNPITLRYKILRSLLRRNKQPYRGTRVIFRNGEAEVFAPRERTLDEALANLDKQPPEAFKVFLNMNGEIAIQQLIKLPHFVLV